MAPALSRTVLAASLVLTGCVSTKYRRADEPTRSVVLHLRAEATAYEAAVQSVIVYQGPGSWKQEAYWDEYLLALANRGSSPVTIESIVLIDGLDQRQIPGSDPWLLEDKSRENLKRFEHHGRKILLGVGLGVAWGMAPAAAVGGALAGSSTLAFAGLAAFFVIPAAVVTHVIVSKHAKREIQAEFGRRRLALPLTLQPQEMRTGSLFFPISPGPQRLEITAHAGEKEVGSVIDLNVLAGLHLLKETVAAPDKPTESAPP